LKLKTYPGVLDRAFLYRRYDNYHGRKLVYKLYDSISLEEFKIILELKEKPHQAILYTNCRFGSIAQEIVTGERITEIETETEDNQRAFDKKK